MKAFYLKRLRTFIHEGLSVHVNGGYYKIVIEHPKLFNKYEVPLPNGMVIPHEIVKRMTYDIMQSEVKAFRKTRQQISNLGWWLAIIMGIIFCVWLSK